MKNTLFVLLFCSFASLATAHESVKSVCSLTKSELKSGNLVSIGLKLISNNGTQNTIIEKTGKKNTTSQITSEVESYANSLVENGICTGIVKLYQN